MYSHEIIASPRLLEVQRLLVEVIVQLLEIDHRLYEICESLPLTPLYLHMEDGSMAYSGFGHLYETVQQVRGCHLKPAIEALRRGSQTSNAEAIAVGAR